MPHVQLWGILQGIGLLLHEGEKPNLVLASPFVDKEERPSLINCPKPTRSDLEPTRQQQQA